VARGEGQPARAARLFGSAASLREAIGFSVGTLYGPEYESEIAALREALGKKVFSAAWEVGCALSWKQAVDYALGEGTV
jgi:hypothetical protein